MQYGDPPGGGGSGNGGYGPPPGGGPPGGYGGPPPTPGGYGGPPPGGYGAPPPGGYGAPSPYAISPAGNFGAPMMGVGVGAPYGIDPVSGLPFSDKSKTVAGLLQLFAGAFGVGRFYTGHIGLAIAQICVVWLTCGLGIFWPIIDGIVMLTGRTTDAQGRPLRDG